VTFFARALAHVVSFLLLVVFAVAGITLAVFSIDTGKSGLASDGSRPTYISPQCATPLVTGLGAAATHRARSSVPWIDPTLVVTDDGFYAAASRATAL
jgi:hypothetical protein